MDSEQLFNNYMKATGELTAAALNQMPEHLRKRIAQALNTGGRVEGRGTIQPPEFRLVLLDSDGRELELMRLAPEQPVWN